MRNYGMRGFNMRGSTEPLEPKARSADSNGPCSELAAPWGGFGTSVISIDSVQTIWNTGCALMPAGYCKELLLNLGNLRNVRQVDAPNNLAVPSRSINLLSVNLPDPRKEPITSLAKPASRQFKGNLIVVSSCISSG